MSDNTPIYRCFHPLVAEAYTAVHQWLDSIDIAKGYKSIDPRKKWQKILQGEDLKSVAFQYYNLFPAHYFKAAHILENVVREDNLISWLRHKQRICILDIGCGAGAGTAAVIEAALILKEKGKISNDINIFAIGVDPNKFSILLYKQLMEKLKTSAVDTIELEFACVKSGFPEATLGIIQNLKKELNTFHLPCLSNILTIQLNVISPFSQGFRNKEEEYNELMKIDPEICNFLTEIPENFGSTEAYAYKQIIEDVPVDTMHVLTIATKNIEKYVQANTNSEVTLEKRVKEMALTLKDVIEKRHVVKQINNGNHEIFFENPHSSYWKDKNRDKTGNPIIFYADFQTIWSADLTEDQDWNGVISLDNLRLAWARARNNLLREALFDETEMRLFELSLDVKLERLREQLCAYAKDVALTDEIISYKIPKNLTLSRPKGISRLEEEILSVAIIQRLGDKASQLRGSSYAYRISGKYGHRDTEYLYEYWFNAYCYYMKKARDSASNYPNGAILNVDIESFYTKIIQDQLYSGLSKELTVSQRIRWLIRLLLSKDIDEHELGQGITQGSIGSGFYANIYLTPIDAKFGSGNEWGVELHRYVDDMIIIIPNPEDMDEVEDTLRDELQKLGLNLNEKKTEKIYDVSLFLEQSEEDEYLERLSNRFKSVVNPLWIMNSEHRAIFASSYHTDMLWWYNIECYQNCLKAIKIYTHETELSRRIYEYLFSSKSRDGDLAKQKEVLGLEGELKSTQPPNSDTFDAIDLWAASFISSNNIWNENRNDLRKQLVELFQNSWRELQESNGSKLSEIRKLQRYIRFALYRLSVLGLEDILNVLMEILREAFWIIRDPINILENLAHQGYHSEIRALLKHYRYHNLEQSAEYLKAITIRAMRFLPNVDAQEWELIVGFATISDSSVSITERLMATETWLYLGHKYNDFKQNRHIEAVKKALRSEPLPPSRLEKNYLLILGQFEPSAVQEFSVNKNDPMLVGARDLALQGSPSEIFDLPEPKILRENYYSGQSPTDDNEKGSP
ncbi:reverse transcriptase domain-containing protein [Lyngbya aestuarii]|uniref:reverse transcriptase domain-containing protein n=1 Tax=Lyngbya aestuarii TaxID=118322 RepID=UPI00403DC83A